MKYILCLILMTMSFSSIASQSIVVLVPDNQPMTIIDSNDAVSGFDIDLFNEVSKRIGVTPKYETTSFSSAIKKIKSGEGDVSLGGLTITSSRLKDVNFSYPYLDSGLSILSHNNFEKTFMNTLKAFFTPQVIKVTFFFFLFVVFSSFIFCFFGRGNPNIPDSFVEGIAESAWLTFTTMSTVGYGDIAPVKWSTRIWAMILMISGISFFGYVIAVYSSIDFDAGKLLSPIHLQGKTVATLSNSSSSDYLSSIKRVSVKTYPNIQTAYLKMATGKVDAVVFDNPSNLYFVTNDSSNNFKIHSEVFDPQKYGFAVSKKNNKLLERINIAILELQKDGTYDNIYMKWFGSEQ